MQYTLLILMLTVLQQGTFKQDQLKHARVKSAYQEKEQEVKGFFTQKKISYQGFHLLIRAFKKEQLLEVWIKEKNRDAFQLLHIYAFCASSGSLGPKRKEGDYQIPEGVYHINHFNPQSNFHLSLGVSYPNASDKIRSDPKHPGGAIYVHGNCVTVGCIPITDEKIRELYILAVEARNNGQAKIPIHIFPARLDEAGFAKLKQHYASAPELIGFWENLKPVYENFEKEKKLQTVKVNQKGEYYF
jgi:murein L,D-transpeptidase YafK